MPMQTNVSLRVGRYSTTSPRGVGTNPGIIRPMPFSIQMPIKETTQATLSQPMRWLSGVTKDQTDKIKGNRRPDPRHQPRVSVESEIQVLGGGNVHSLG